MYVKYESNGGCGCLLFSIIGLLSLWALWAAVLWGAWNLVVHVAFGGPSATYAEAVGFALILAVFSAAAGAAKAGG